MKNKPTYRELEIELNTLSQKLAISEKQDRFISFFENNKAIMLEIDSISKQIINANISAINFYGYTKRELLQKKISELQILPPNKINKLMQKAVKNKSDLFQFKHKLANGKQRDVEVYSSPLKVADKMHIFVTILDVTNRIEAEKQLNKLSTAVSQSSNTIIITDIDGNIEYTNPRFTELTGYSAEEVLGKNPRILSAGTQADEHYNKIWQTITTGKTWKGEFCNRTKSGNLYWEQATITPIKGENGKLSNYLAIKEDITDRKKADLSLYESKENYRLLTETMKDVVIRISITGKLLFVSSAVTEFGGYIAKDEIGNDISKYFANKNDIKRAFKLIKEIEKTHKSGYFEFQYQPKNKNSFPVEQTYIPLIKNNKVYAIQLVLRDVSKHKKIELDLKKRDTYITALNKATSLLSQDNSIPYQKFVEIIGKAANASRTYIFINHIDKKGNLLMSQKAEYCAKGINSEIDNPNLQNLSYVHFDRMNKLLSKGKLYKGRIKEFPKSEKEFLELQNIKSILIIPILIDKHFWGFIGFDNCLNQQGWTLTEQNYLETAAKNLQQEIKRDNTQILLQAENERFHKTMDAIDAIVYVADIETYELIYLNKLGKKLAGDGVGKKCYAVLQKGQTKPCDFCTNHLLTDENGSPKEPYIWEFQNTKTKQWFQCRDQVIPWVDGSFVRIEIATDISDRKESENLLKKSKAQLKKMNTRLKNLVLKEVGKSREKDRMMIVQSRQAAMGEMVGSIAHQWRQPLNEIGLYVQNLQDRFEHNTLSTENLNHTIEKTMLKIEYLSQTIDDFRNFFRSDKEKRKFSLTKSISKTLSLTEASFKNNFIKTNVNLQENLFLTGYSNEFSQAILNILNNAKDVLIERKVENPNVKIQLAKTNRKTIFSISDNGGGISKEIINHIFEPYFTTKDKATGTGLGLFISKTIIERNMKGKLSAKNIKNGVKFKIEFEQGF